MKPHRGPGRPLGSRTRLNKQFLDDLLASWRQHGPDVLEVLRCEDPGAYARLVAGTLPKELVLDTTMNELSDADLDDFIITLRQHMLTKPEQPLLIEGKVIDGQEVFDSGVTGEVVEATSTRGGDQAATRRRK